MLGEHAISESPISSLSANAFNIEPLSKYEAKVEYSDLFEYTVVYRGAYES